VPDVHRVLVVDDHPEIRVLIRARLRMLDDVEVVGEASNGAEGLVLVSALAPDVVVLDLKMPVMGGDATIPKMRELAPGMRILLYTGVDAQTLEGLSERARPDVIVHKGSSLTELADQVRLLIDMGPHDVIRIVLGEIPLRQAVAAFDTWVGLNVRILESMARGDELVSDQLGGATSAELRALIGVYAHVGDNLQKAAREHAAEVTPVIHVLRATGAAARRALQAFDPEQLEEFYAAWDYAVPPSAVTALTEMHGQLMDALPSSGADPRRDEQTALEDRDEPSGDREDGRSDRVVAATDRAAAAIDRAAAAQDRAAASSDELTGTYLRGPGHVELKREIARARRTDQPLVLAFFDVDGLKAVNDSRGHEAGDQLLRGVTDVLRHQLREYDVIVRHGGDEFVCALPGVSLATARTRLAGIHAAVVASGEDWGVSAGLAILEDEDSLETLIRRADAAMYEHRLSRPGRRVGS